MIIKKIMVHAQILKSDFQHFNAVDYDILRSIVKRKYKISIQPKDLDDESKLLDILNRLDDNRKTSKRSEENNKLVFKRAIKFLINKYKKDN